MLHHLVPDEVAPGSLVPNLDFYEPRTAHGSSLSPAIHAALLARAGRFGPALEALRIAARIDLDDLTGTTAGGLHLATMGGLWQALAFGFAGARAPPGAWTGSTPARGVGRARAPAEVSRLSRAGATRARLDRGGCGSGSAGLRLRLAWPQLRASRRKLEGGKSMKKVIAALDNSLAAGAVLATAHNLAPLFGAEVEAVHVGEDGDRATRDAAAAAGVQLKRIAGPTVPALVKLLQPTTWRPWWSGRAACLLEDVRSERPRST